MDKDPVLISADRPSVDLYPAQSWHISELQGWFTDLAGLTQWAGPGMRWPLTTAAFADIIRWQQLSSFVLQSTVPGLPRQMLAFGQYYTRLQRHHLGRLAVHPGYRGQGLGKVLISQLVAHARAEDPDMGVSLFVMAANKPAVACYQAMGFVETSYPEPLPEGLQECLFMLLDDAEPTVAS